MVLATTSPIAVAYAVRLAEGLQNFFPWLTNIDCRVLYLHPVLVNFVAACVPVSLVFDFGSRIFKRESFRVVAASITLVALAIQGHIGGSQ